MPVHLPQLMSQVIDAEYYSVLKIINFLKSGDIKKCILDSLAQSILPAFRNFSDFCKNMYYYTPVFLHGESHGQRSLVGYSPWGRKESDTTERLTHTHTHTHEGFPGGSDGKASVYISGDPGSSPGLGRSPGEGNGNPLQDYCLENPMDRGAW